MRIIFLFISILIISFSCKPDKVEKSDLEDQATETETTFDKTRWRVKEGKNYLFREQMLNDIVYNDIVRLLRKDEILELLGEPDRINEGHLYYTISRTSIGSWTLHSKTMVIKLTENDRIDWIKIHE